MNQYTEYIRKVIIEAVTTTEDKDILQIIYGILMNSSNPQEHPINS